MRHYLATASRLVTSNDELVEFLEALECLILKAAFHCNDCNLRGAWLVNKRAIGVAQLMGLDTATPASFVRLTQTPAYHPR